MNLNRGLRKYTQRYVQKLISLGFLLKMVFRVSGAFGVYYTFQQFFYCFKYCGSTFRSYFHLLFWSSCAFPSVWIIYIFCGLLGLFPVFLDIFSLIIIRLLLEFFPVFFGLLKNFSDFLWFLVFVRIFFEFVVTFGSCKDFFKLFEGKVTFFLRKLFFWNWSLYICNDPSSNTYPIFFRTKKSNLNNSRPTKEHQTHPNTS